jgi:hypothetical protein
MTAPQMKEGPASSMLRAMFAGFGSLMSVMDRVRNKPSAGAPADAEAPAPAAPAPAAAAPEAAAEPEATAVPEPAAEPETVVAATTTHPETVAVETPAVPEPETATESETASALPLANYDELTVASLRARLRNLTNDDLTQLMTYEKANQNRPEVIKMFQNRLIKMTSGMPKLEE